MPVFLDTKFLKKLKNFSKIFKETMINIINGGCRGKNDIKKIPRKLGKELGCGIIESGLNQA